MKKVKVLLAISVGLLYSVVLSFVLAILVNSTGNIYVSYVKPNFIPKPAVFSVMWGIIYFCFTINIADIFSSKIAKDLIFCYFILLVLNILYVVTFFRLGLPLFSLVICFLILSTIIYMFVRGLKLEIRSIYLFLLVISWYIFVLILTYHIVILN